MTNKTLLILRYELVSTLRSRSFVIISFVIPMVAVLVFLGVSLLQDDGAAVPEGSPAGFAEEPDLKVEGYVDEAGIISQPAAELPPGTLIGYPDEASAREALGAGEIAAYYIIPADYIAEGELIYVNPDYRPAGYEGQDWVMRQTIFQNLLGNDPERLARAWNAMEVEVRPLSEALARRHEDSDAAFYVPYGTMMVFYFVLIMTASLLLSSVSNEKKNRTMEVLLVSVNPRQMLTGKIVGLGILGLLQMVIWSGTAYGLVSMSGRTLNLAVDIVLPPELLVWAIVFFLLGYAVYASLMAGLGALVPSMKEASQSVMLVIWPLLIPMFLIVVIIEQPASALAVGLSLFPLTAPIAMLTRMAAVAVPWWQPAAAAVLMLATAVLVVRSVAGMFRAQILLSGQPVTARRFFSALLGRL